MRQQLLVDDPLGDAIGNGAFQAVTDLDAGAAVIARHQKQHAVIDVLTGRSRLAAPQLPGLGHPYRIGLDGLGLRGRHHQHGQLATLAFL